MANGKYLFEVVTSDDEGLKATKSQREANMELAAAAPKLLAALEEAAAVMTVCAGNHPTSDGKNAIMSAVRRARAAIEEATS